jgi:hypothetical protein
LSVFTKEEKGYNWFMKKIIITGGSGFLGTQIINKLVSIGGYEIVIIDLVSPRQAKKNVLFFKKNLSESFDPQIEYLELQNPYAVIHLAGKSIYGRFTKKHKQEIWDSRVEGTRNIVDLLSHGKYKPKFFIAASAVGFYGNQPKKLLVESSPRKNYYYLSDVVVAWERESLRARKFGINVTCIRNGHIIGVGGMLSEVASLFKFGVGGVLGTGKEHMPWIDIRDLVDLYVQCVESENAFDIINGVSCSSNTQKDFSDAIGRVKKTLLYIHIQQWMLFLKFGEFGREMLVDQDVQSEICVDIPFVPVHVGINEVVTYYLAKK